MHLAGHLRAYKYEKGMHLAGHLVVLIDERHELPTAGNIIFHREGVGNIPPDGAKFPSVLDHGVKETKGKEQLFEHLRLVRLLEQRVVDGGVGPEQIGPQAFGVFVGHFDAILQDLYGKGGGGHGREPQDKVFMDMVWTKLFANCV